VRNLLLSLVAFTFLGCLTPRKADRQLDNVSKKFPSKIASVCNEKFPFMETTDTIENTEYDWIEIECPELVAKNDTLCLYDTIIVTKKVKSATKTITIIKYVEDSAKIKIIEDKLRECSNRPVQVPKQETKKSFTEILSYLFGFIALLLYFVARRKKKR